jgi:hypothetical protein
MKAVTGGLAVHKAKKILLRAVRLLVNAVINFAKKSSERGPKFWITAAVAARAAYSVSNEYGWNPFKKDIKKDHVFLTGASGNVGKELAVKLGLMGCKLSLAGVTQSAMDELRIFLIAAGIPEENFHIFYCDVGVLTSVKEAAVKAKAQFGDVTILINNAGIVNGKTILELSEDDVNRSL